MRGAVAAGNRHTAEAGAWALREGGTCVDAALAAVFAAFVTEGPLTGPAAGASSCSTSPAGRTSCSTASSPCPPRRAEEMDEVEIDFADASTQIFHVGEASVAVPGLCRGLQEAHERRGRLPWPTLFVPALELAAPAVRRDGGAGVPPRDPRPDPPARARRAEIYGTPGQIDATDLVPTLRLLRDARGEAVAILLPELGEDIERLPRRGAPPLEGRSPARRCSRPPRPSLGAARSSRPGSRRSTRTTRGRPGSADEARALAAALAAGIRRGRPAPAGRARPGRRTSRWSTPTAPRSGSPRRSAPARACSGTASSSTTCSASST